VLPRVTNSFSLGSTNYRYNSVHTSNLYANVLASTSGSGSSYSIQIVNNLLPGTTNTYGLGSSGAYWSAIWGGTVRANTIAAVGGTTASYSINCASNFLPSSTNTFALGNSDKRWNSIYGNVGNFSSLTVNGESIPTEFFDPTQSTSIIPVDNAQMFGDSTHYWSNGYFGNLNVFGNLFVNGA